ncbi:MAG: hypothetical protein R2748_02985 [Bryobacterales bacterium]
MSSARGRGRRGRKHSADSPRTGAQPADEQQPRRCGRRAVRDAARSRAAHRHHLRLSQIDREKRRFSQAWDHLKQALGFEPESLDIKYNGVLLAQAEGKDDDAIARLKAILDETKQANYEPRERANRVMFLEHLGSALSLKDFDAAIDVYNQIGEINPEAMSRVKALIVDAAPIATTKALAGQGGPRRVSRRSGLEDATRHAAGRAG